ncbi:hypothetical protein [Fibrella forsythiae]|uniref:Uncharacterized protein n=1 Tax=Fibrella forsythiae TaxID=2817061 RepID=A0ABS3JPI8_9BACT|nr:hypothetical protein [Fibrella forsythiae]MBO0951903.1 hypothetical protein [Fibrella forsythiae]
MNCLLPPVQPPGAAMTAMGMQTGVPAMISYGYRLSIQAVMAVFCWSTKRNPPHWQGTQTGYAV